MKTAELLALLAGGTVVTIAEWRGADAAPIEYMDKATGKKAEMTGIRHSVELGNKALVATEDVPEGFKADDYKPPFKKGDKVVLVLVFYGWVKGRGERARVERIEKYEAS